MKGLKLLFNGILVLMHFGMLAAAGLLLWGVKPAIVLSGSMEPEIPTGSLCLINTKADIEQIQEGDILAFSSGTMSVTHRVMGITDSGFQTKGDANDTPDPGIVPKENVTGKTVFWIPYAGYLVHKAGTVSGKIVLGMVLILSILIGFLERRPKQKEESKA